MSFTVPSREDVADVFIKDYAAAQPEKNVARGSDPWRLARVISGIIWLLLAKLLFFVKQMLPDTAEREFLERWGTVYDFPRLPATGATAPLGLRVTGTVGNAVPLDTELAHADGTIYKVATTGAVVGGSGYVDVDVEATSKGLATNKGTDEVLTFTTPPTGIDADATVVVGLTGGLNIESYDAYRVRLLAHIGDPPEGGAIHDYEEWAKRIPGVVTAYVWAHRRGRGTMDVAVLGGGTGANRVVSSDVSAAVDSYIETVRPGNVRDFEVLTMVPQNQDVECAIEIDDTAYSWDWDDAGVGYAITAHNSTAKTITVPTAPATVKAGVRLTVLGEEAKVTNRTGDVLTLAFSDNYDGNAVAWFTFTVSTQDIRASGDLVTPTRNAIFKLFNSLGPARSRYSETHWISELKLSKLFAAITDVTGVDDATITTPATNINGTDDYSDSVPFLVPRYIKVWKP